MTRKDHWEQVYSTRLAEKLGWYKPHLETSMNWIAELGLDKSARIIDVGCGASTLVDDLLDAGFESIAVLDISDSALAVSKKRLGRQADMVMWLSGDVTSTTLPPDYFELWHDRAVLHFLTEPDQQAQYRDSLLKSLRPGGHAIVGAFSSEAPPKCSGLPVRRYEPDQLAELLGSDFEPVRHHKELHVTPGGVEQMYVYCQFRRKND